LIANKGKWNRPHLAKKVGDVAPQDLLRPPEAQLPAPLPDIIFRDPKTWQQVSNGMQQVMHNPRGTARKVGDSAVYRMAGKSGTAQVVAIKQGEKYDRSKVQERHRDHALFIAFAPADNPKIAVAVMIENGESGSGVAAPIVKKVTDAWLLGPDGQLKPEFRSPADLSAKPLSPQP
jgi:penicillin-binding protein 2